MSHPGRIIRRAFIGLMYGGGTMAAIFFGAVAIKAFIHAKPVQAASESLYPSFCLGGWDHPQHASGPAHADTTAQYAAGNSAFLASQVSSQLFCGYFDIPDKINPPSIVTVKFNWDMRQTQAADPAVLAPAASSSSSGSVAPQPAPSFAAPVVASPAAAAAPVAVPSPAASTSSYQSSSSSESYTATASSSGPVISPATGLTPVSTPAPAAAPAAPISAPTPIPTPAPSAAPSAASAAPVQSPAAVPAPPASAPAPTPVAAPAALAAPAPAAAPAASVAAPASDASAPAPAAAPAAGPSSFLDDVLYAALAPSIARASSGDAAHSAQPFLSVSYSIDGVRWVSIGTVGSDNWRGYAVSIPVSSWDDVRHLQIMVNVMPTVDPKPDIYLESIAAQAQYDRTTKEALSDTVAAAANAVSSLADAVVGSSDASPNQDESSASSTSATDAQISASSTDASLVAEAFKALPAPAILPLFHPAATPPPVYITKRALTFALGGAPLPGGPRGDIKPSPSADGSSLTISGSCTKKYYVVLVYKTAADYEKKPSSFVANEARDCVGGSFAYDVSALPPELKSGTYYVVTADEDDSGPWTPSSKIFPVTIQATTTTVEVSSQ